jgi:two-component system CheB/CheR fusion protein
MNNLLAGTGIGTVFVDNNLRILRFTPSVTQVINLIPGDLGRPVDHIVSNLVGYQTLIADIRKVLDTLQPHEAEVLTKNHAWHLMRIRPYRTVANTIEGVVLTFVDISELKLAEQRLRENETRYLSIFNQALAGLAQTDVNGLFTMVNDRFCEMLGYARDELLRLRMMDITHVEDKPRNRVLLDELLAGGQDYSVEKRYVRRDLSVVWVAERVSAIRDHNKVQSLVSIVFDVDPTEAKARK